jgi:hypothetical protein
VLSAEATCRNAIGSSILRLCEVKVLDDPLNEFANVQVENLNVTAVPSRITVLPSMQIDKFSAYLAAPYPCKLRVISNGGVRVITFPPARDITPQEQADLQKAAVRAIMECYVRGASIKDLVMHYRWLPNPPFDAEIAQLWQIVVSELTARDDIELLGLGDTVLASARPNDRGVALLSHWSEGAARLEELGLRVNVPEAPGREIRRHVAVKQVQLELRSQLPLSGERAELAFSQAKGRTVLTVNTSEGRAAYDVTAPRMPLPVAVPATARFTPRRLGAQYDARISHHEHEVRSADHEGNLPSLLGGIAQRAIAAAYDFVVRGGGVAETILLARLAAGGATRIERVKVPGARRAFALVGRDGTSRVVDASDLASVREIGHYHERPWFLDSARSGKVFARISADGKHIAVYEITQVREI